MEMEIRKLFGIPVRVVDDEWLVVKDIIEALKVVDEERRKKVVEIIGDSNSEYVCIRHTLLDTNNIKYEKKYNIK